MRDLDAFDYALVAAVSLLAYLELPWRPEVRERLRDLATRVAAIEVGSEVYFAGIVLGTAIFILLATKVWPRLALR